MATKRELEARIRKLEQNSKRDAMRAEYFRAKHAETWASVMMTRKFASNTLGELLGIPPDPTLAVEVYIDAAVRDIKARMAQAGFRTVK